VQLSRQKNLADRRNKAVFTPVCSPVYVNSCRSGRSDVCSRSCLSVANSEHSRRSQLAGRQNQDVFTPEYSQVSVNSCGCSHSCCPVARAKASRCLQFTARQNQTVDVPVQHQFDEAVHKTSSRRACCSLCVPVVKSELDQHAFNTDRRSEVVPTPEHSRPCLLATVAKCRPSDLSTDSRKADLFTNYYSSNADQMLSSDQYLYDDVYKRDRQRSRSDEVQSISQNAVQSDVGRSAVEPGLELLVHTRSKLLRFRPSHCKVDRAVNALILYFDIDELCLNISLGNGAASANSTERLSEHLIDYGHMDDGPPVVVCRGIFTDDEEASKSPFNTNGSRLPLVAARDRNRLTLFHKMVILTQMGIFLL